MYGRNQHHCNYPSTKKKERKKERKKRKQAKNKTNKHTNEQVWDAKEKKSVCGPTLATSALSNSHRVL